MTNNCGVLIRKIRIILRKNAQKIVNATLAIGGSFFGPSTEN